MPRGGASSLPFSLLPGVFPACRKLRTRLALPTAVVAVRVLRDQFMAPFAVRLTGIASRERLTPFAVHYARNGFPVSRVLAGAMLAIVPARTARAVVARMIDLVTWSERTDKMQVAEPVRGHGPAATVGLHPVVLPVPVRGPRPALIGATLFDLGQIEVQETPATAPRGLCTLATGSVAMFRHGSIVAPSARAVEGVIRHHGW